MTDLERADLRIRCVEPFIQTASRLDLDKGLVFDWGEQLFKFATETPVSPSADTASAPAAGA